MQSNKNLSVNISPERTNQKSYFIKTFKVGIAINFVGELLLMFSFSFANNVFSRGKGILDGFRSSRGNKVARLSSQPYEQEWGKIQSGDLQLQLAQLLGLRHHAE